MRLLRSSSLFTFCAALLLRLLWVWAWQRTPYSLVPYLDARAYFTWAHEILAGKSGGVFYQSPLYPYWLAGWFALAGDSPIFVSIAQAVLGAATCAVFARTTTRHFGVTAGVAAGLIAATNRTLIFFVAPMLKETLVMLTLALFVDAYLRLATDGRRRDAFASGVWLGLSTLGRGNVLLLAPLLPFVSFRRNGMSRVLISGAAFVGILLPATLHNYFANGEFVLINSAGGFNFFIGNSPSATGASGYPAFVSTDPGREEADVHRVAVARVGHELSSGETSNY